MHHINKRDGQIPKKPDNETEGPLKCNGDASICDLRYDQVVDTFTKFSLSFFFFKKKRNDQFSNPFSFCYLDLSWNA